MTDTDTENTDSGPSGFANPEFVERSAVRAEEHRKEQDRAKSEAGGTQAWLEEELDQRSKEAEIFGRVFEFRPIGTGFVSDTVERANKVNQDGDDRDLGEMPALLRDICAKLGEHCLDPGMNREQFESIPPSEVQQVYEEVAAELDDEERERIERFRE